MERILTKVVAILPAVDWFEVRGAEAKPTLRRVAYWAHIKYVDRDPSTGKPFDQEHDIVIGITGADVPLSCYDYLDTESPVGYIHLDDLDDGRKIPSSYFGDYAWDD